MANEKSRRRLAAILAADMVEYSRLVEADEEGTIARQKRHRQELIDPTIARHGGRIFHLAGDGLLAEFPSTVDAVRCAVEIQRAMPGREAGVPEDKRIRYRVGVNLGDVVAEGEDIYGDGVNLAARLQALADPGGVLISGTAYDHLKATVDAGYQDLGTRRVKNIAKPVRVYRVLLDAASAGKVIRRRSATARLWLSVATALVLVVAGTVIWWQPWSRDGQAVSTAQTELPLPDLPSIAVLPFDDISPGGSDDYLADGLTETLITMLGQLPDLFVIARNSSFTYKGRAVDVRQVGRELGVRHILEGSIQRSGDRIRVTAQLVDATTGEHLWAERYDRPVDDIFELQDEIALRVVVSLQGELTQGADAFRRSSSTRNVEAYLRFLRGLNSFYTFSQEGMVETRRWVDEALALDPDYAMAKLLGAWSHLIDARYGYSESPDTSLSEVESALQQLGFPNQDLSPYVRGTSYLVHAYLFLLRGRHDIALSDGEEAVTILPNHANILATHGSILEYSGHHDEAIMHLRRSMRLNPHYPSWQALQLSTALTFTGNHADAIVAARDGIARAESDFIRAAAYMRLAFAYADQGRVREAREAAENVRELAPYLTIEWFRSRYGNLYRKEADAARFENALRAAGLPE